MPKGKSKLSFGIFKLSFDKKNLRILLNLRFIIFIGKKVLLLHNTGLIVCYEEDGLVSVLWLGCFVLVWYWLNPCSNLTQSRTTFGDTLSLLPISCLKTFWFGLMLYVPVNSYGHVRLSVPLAILFPWARLTKKLTSTLCTYICL